MHSIGERLRSLTEVLGEIAGVPSYRHFTAHWLAHHPDRAVPTRKQFFEMAQCSKRAAAGRTRCC